jgi:tetratricopeptide (TPR) repeat protein
VILIGVDGADPEILERLISEGRLPTFERLKREGAFGPLRSREPLLSPIVWTTIATGRKASDHGVLDFVELSPKGEMVPITSTRRRVAALWNIASEFHVSSGFIGWYGSYPAEDVLGFSVSDRLAFHQVASARAARQATFPEALAARLHGRFGDPVIDLEQARKRLLADPAAMLSADGERRLGELAKLLATAEFYRRITPELVGEYHPALLSVYFELVDACGHLFMEDAPPRRAGVSDADFHAFSGTVDRCYAYQDGVVADLLALEGPGTVTFVLSDHGFKSGEVRPETSGRADTGQAPLWHRLHGILALHGRSVRPAASLRDATILDVAPTALALLGIPLSRELPGNVLSAAFSDLPVAQKTSRAYLAPRHAVTAGGEADPEALERLRALGYLGQNGTEAPAGADERWRTAASYLNEGAARSAEGDFDGARDAYGRAVAMSPRSVGPLVALAGLEIQRHALPRARELLDQAERFAPRDATVRLQSAAWALEAGRWEDAAGELAAARSLDDRLPYLHVLAARLRDREGRSQEALGELQRAEALTDSETQLGEILNLEARISIDLKRLPEARSALDRAQTLVRPSPLAVAEGDLAMAGGDAARAVRFYGQALRDDPGDAVLDRKLGEALGASGSSAEAEAAFRRALAEARVDRDAEGACGDLSLLLQGQGREPEARRVLEDGVRHLPGSSALWAMLGAAWGRDRNYPRAISAYERSIALRPTALACKTLAALVFEEQKDPVRAVALWRQSLVLDPGQKDVEAFLERYGGRPRNH